MHSHGSNPLPYPPTFPSGPENPHDSAWTVHEKLLRTELEAQRDADLHKERFWLIESSQVKNRTGKVRSLFWVKGRGGVG
jgi:Cu2+-containing amine oxidase